MKRKIDYYKKLENEKNIKQEHLIGEKYNYKSLENEKNIKQEQLISEAKTLLVRPNCLL